MKNSTYTFKNGITKIIPKFDCNSHEGRTFKLNLPSDLEDFLTGNGEGIWGCADEETYQAIINDHKSTKENPVYFIKALNDSLYYNGLMFGDIVAVELRGKNRPVAFLDELTHKYGASQKDIAMANFLNAKHR